MRNCEHCQTPLSENASVCPACGTLTEKGKVKKRDRIVLVVAIAVVAAALIGVLICWGLGLFDKEGTNRSSAKAITTQTQPSTTEAPPSPSQDSTEPTQTPAEPLKTGVYTKDSYTVSDSEAEASRLTVVATLGDAELTNGVLRVCYWDNVRNYLDTYADYLDTLGLDAAQPLDQQDCPLSEGTWQQYFLEKALDSWYTYQALSLAHPEISVAIDIEIENTEELYGAGCANQDYYDFQELYSLSLACFEEEYKQIQISNELLQAYLAENPDATEEQAREALTDEAATSILSQVLAQYVLNVDYEAISLSSVTLK